MWVDLNYCADRNTFMNILETGMSNILIPLCQGYLFEIYLTLLYAYNLLIKESVNVMEQLGVLYTCISIVFRNAN
jgi:hypothetical protein